MTPSRLSAVERMLLALVRGHGREFIVGDMLERFEDDLARGMDVRRARRRLRRQILASVVGRFGRRVGAQPRTDRSAHASLSGRPDAPGGELVRDIALAFRGAARRPGFALGVACTLGLGIGATTTIYSIVDGVLLRPLAYEDSESLVAVGALFPDREWEEGASGLQHLAGISMANFTDFQERTRSFESLAAIEISSILR